MAATFSSVRTKLKRLRLRWQLTQGPLAIQHEPTLTISNYGKAGRPTKRALLHYLPQPVIQNLKGDTAPNFSNSGLAVAWAHVLDRLGYCVDIVGWDDTVWQPTQSYDLVVTHGGHNVEQLKKLQAAGSTLLYFASGSYWKFHNQAGQQRSNQLFKRTGKRIQPERQVEEPEEAVLQMADTIIALGTPAIASTYKDFSNVSAIEIGAYPDNHTDHISKDYTQARNHFVFFAGGGNLHKGLDIVLEAFADTPYSLTVCTSLNPEFEQLYARELAKPTINFRGVIALGSAEFYDIIDAAAYVILPSCAEGSPGSVADCMQQGLIPVVTREAGVEIGDFGFTIEDINPQALRTLITKLATLPPEEVARRSSQTRRHSQAEQSPGQFETKLETLVKRALSSSPSSSHRA